MATEKSSIVRLMDNMRLGMEHTISFPDTDIVPQRNLTICNLAALTFIRTAFSIVEQSKESVLADVVPKLASNQTIEESLAICRRWRDTLHLDFEDIYQVPMFERSLKQVSTKYGQPTVQHFRDTLQEMQHTNSSVAVIIVRAPDSIVCLKLFEPENNVVFVVFNPRSSPDHPKGLAMTFSKSIEQTARRLSILMPSDKRALQNDSLQWQARLLSNCSSYVFVPKSSAISDPEGSILFSSMSLLKLQAERAELQQQNRSLLTKSQNLERRVTELQGVFQEEQEKAAQRYLEHQSRRASRPSYNEAEQPSNRRHHSESSTKQTDLSVIFTPKGSDPNFNLALELQRTYDENRSLIATRPLYSEAAQPLSRSRYPQSTTKKADLGATSTPNDDDPNFNLALELQRTYDPENRRIITSRPSYSEAAQPSSRPRHLVQSPMKQINPGATFPSKDRYPNFSLALEPQRNYDPQNGRPIASRPLYSEAVQSSNRPRNTQSSTKRTDLGVTSTPKDSDPNLNLALELQRGFDLENRELIAQRDVLLKTAQRQYHCGVCLDDFPEDDVVRIDPCGHEICRDCARGHVSAKINEHRFPVLCPVCMADHGNPNPSMITGLLVQLLGVSEEQYETWVEMEMAQFSTLIQCRKCNQTAFVDRNDIEATERIQCPVLGCDHVWCRKCQQSVEPGGPEHSCDGSKELDHLVQQEGWKYCPNCKTPIQKLSGCNHMSCVAPGCNTHFCYGCGVTINRTAIPSEIAAGKAEHFRNCRIW